MIYNRPVSTTDPKIVLHFPELVPPYINIELFSPKRKELTT